MAVSQATRNQIDKALEHGMHYALYAKSPSMDADKAMMTSLSQMLKEEIPFDPKVMNYPPSHALTQFLSALLSISEWDEKVIVPAFDEKHPFVITVVNASALQGMYKYAIWQYVSLRLSNQPLDKVEPFMQFLLQQGFSEDDIIKYHFTHSHSPIYAYRSHGSNVESGFAGYLKPLLEGKKGMLGFGGKEGKAALVHEALLSNKQRHGNRAAMVLEYLYHVNPALIDGYVKQYIVQHDYQGNPQLEMFAVRSLLKLDAARFMQDILDVIAATPFQMQDLFEVFYLMDLHSGEDYSEPLQEIGEHYMTLLEGPPAHKYIHDYAINHKGMSVVYMDYLLRKNEEAGKARLLAYLQKAQIIFPAFLVFLDEKFGAAALPFFGEVIGKESMTHESLYTKLYGILDKYNYDPLVEKSMQHAIHHATKADRQVICLSLARQGGQVIQRAKELVQGKTVNERIVGAMILAQLDTPEIKVLLAEIVDREINDDTRNIILDTLREDNVVAPLDVPGVKRMIQKAEDRRKLNKWNEKALAEESLAPLYWTGTDDKLSEPEIRFLFYRMRQAKGLNSDAEARELIRYIDKERSERFASQLLQAFVDSNADTRLKYYLTLCGLLGDDTVLNKLNTLFKKSIADKRLKMAEYVLGAIAMIGTDKALRIVEVISRKLANKKPNLSQAAVEALQAAATELGITQDQLADRIIPDFGFEGLYKHFTAGDESYRAFINSDFKVCFYNESNQLRKSPPAGIDKELATAFKEIDKEVRDITRTQHDRLERYMVEGRKWPVEEWRQLFFHNPIMFIYATKLLWGLYDADDKLISTFYCDEDMEAFDVEDESVDLDIGASIAILHPVDLDESQLDTWKEKLYHSNLKTIFPIVERKIFGKLSDELESSSTKAFLNTEVPKGADYAITHLVKNGWRKENGDGGSIVFTKHLQRPKLFAHANIEGPAVIYQGGTAKATVYEISFHKHGWNESVKIKDVPGKFFSETMADIDSLVKAN